jgi:hypothetical protein
VELRYSFTYSFTRAAAYLAYHVPLPVASASTVVFFAPEVEADTPLERERGRQPPFHNALFLLIFW